MDIEFDLSLQQSVYSDMFSMSYQTELVWRRIDIEALPPELLMKIMMFLSAQDVFVTLSLTSPEFYRLINKQHPFRQTLMRRILERSIGFGMPVSSQIDCEKILKMLMRPSLSNSNIPFYGYATNSGFDQLHEYWIDTIFIEGPWSICSREASSNINIAGAIIDDPNNNYAIYLKNYKVINEVIHNICLHIKHNYNGESLPLTYIKRVFHKFSLEESEETEKLFKIQAGGGSYQVIRQKYPNQSEIQSKIKQEEMLGLLRIALDLYQKTSLTKNVVLPIQERVIEDSQTVLCSNSVNILTGIQISREGSFSCPVRTIMVFGSDERIRVDKNPLLDEYNDLICEEQIEQIIERRHLKITDTNMHFLEKQAMYFDREAEFKFAVFGKSQQSQGNDFCEEQKSIYPIAWVQFTSSHIDSIALQFRRLCWFACKHVVAKLIDCDNRVQLHDRQLQHNIDINYIQFKGIHLKLN